MVRGTDAGWCVRVVGVVKRAAKKSPTKAPKKKAPKVPAKKPAPAATPKQRARKSVPGVESKEAKRAAHVAARQDAIAAAMPPIPAVPVSSPFFGQWTSAEREQVWAVVLHAIANGASYRAACKGQQLDPGSYFRDWVSTSTRLAELRAAQEAQAEFYVDRINARVAKLLGEPESGATPGAMLLLDMPTVVATKLAVDTDRWLASVTAPKRYGAKVQVEKTVTKLTIELRDESGARWQLGRDQGTDPREVARVGARVDAA